MNDPDVLIIGSGPAGVSAAWPLVEAGVRVGMVDAGLTADAPSRLDERGFTERRLTDPEQWRVFLGTDVALLGKSSPKLRAPECRHVFRGFAERTGIDTENFTAHGSLAAGGLSNAWGCGAGAFTDEELADFPVTRAELLPSYGAVAARIGVNGSLDDDLAQWYGTEHPVQPPPDIHPLVGRLFDRYRRLPPDPTFRLGRLRMAVITEDLDGRQGCDRAMMCIWGCRRRAVYNAADELPALRRHANFGYQGGWLVTRIQRQGSAGFAVQAESLNGGRQQVFVARRVILAAGTIGSTRLALDLLGSYDQPVPILTAPSMSFALFMPGHVGTPAADRAFAHANLALALTLPEFPGQPALFASILPTDGLLPTELSGRLPLLRPFGRWLAARLWPHLLAGVCFFPGSLTDNSLTLGRPEGPERRSRLLIRGAYRPALDRAVALTRQRLVRHFARLGAWVLPTSTILARPGEDMHYAGTLPMRAQPGRLETDRWGQPSGCQGLHIADGSVLSSLPGKSHTLTIMANADRIAHRIVQEIGRETGR